MADSFPSDYGLGGRGRGSRGFGILGVNPFQSLGIVIIVIAAVYFHRHTTATAERRSTEFRFNQSYNRVSAFKHDVFKQLCAEIIPILLLSQNAHLLFNPIDLINNVIGRASIIFVYFLVFYHIVEPYVANKTGLW